MFGCASDEQLLRELGVFEMEKCRPYNGFKYRVFETYYGKFFNTEALCDCVDIDTAERIITVFSEYYKNRPFEFFFREIEK